MEAMVATDDFASWILQVRRKLESASTKHEQLKDLCGRFEGLSRPLVRNSASSPDATHLATTDSSPVVGSDFGMGRDEVQTPS